MKKLIYALSISALSVMFMGCPYKTKVNLESNPSEKVESSLLGTYEEKGSSTYDYVVSKNTANTYKIEKISTSTKKTSSTYIGYTTTIKGTRFLATKQKKSYESSTPPDYYLYKIEPNASGTIVKLYEVTDNIKEKFESAKELKEFIAKYKDLSFFYEKKVLKYYKKDEDDE